MPRQDGATCHRKNRHVRSRPHTGAWRFRPSHQDRRKVTRGFVDSLQYFGRCSLLIERLVALTQSAVELFLHVGRRSACRPRFASLGNTALRDGPLVLPRRFMSPSGRIWMLNFRQVPTAMLCPLWVISGHCAAIGHVRFTPKSGHVRCTRMSAMGQ